MKGYDLDEKKGGLLGLFSIKSPSKIIKTNDSIELKHFGSFDLIKATVLESGENSVKIRSKDTVQDASLSKGDHVVLYFTSNESYVLSGEIDSIDSADPLEAVITVRKIEKTRNAKKNQRVPVCMQTSLKVIGIQENIPAVAKDISFNGVRLNCKEDIMLEDFIDVTVLLDNTNKYVFKGRVVRKNPLADCTEYGIEVHEIGESSVRNLTRYINQLA